MIWREGVAGHCSSKWYIGKQIVSESDIPPLDHSSSLLHGSHDFHGQVVSLNFVLSATAMSRPSISLHPQHLTVMDTLLRQPHLDRFHLSPGRLQLHAWRLSGDHLVRPDSPVRQQSAWCGGWKTNPFTVYIPLITEFLTFHFLDKQLAPGTGYGRVMEPLLSSWPSLEAPSNPFSWQLPSFWLRKSSFSLCSLQVPEGANLMR